MDLICNTLPSQDPTASIQISFKREGKKEKEKGRKERKEGETRER